MQIHPYICFEGRADEAIKYYCETLGAEVVAMMRGSDAPPTHAVVRGRWTPTRSCTPVSRSESRNSS